MGNEKWQHKNKNNNNKKMIMWNMKNVQSKIKPITFGKQPGATYCFWCKDYAKKFRPEKVKMTNKVLKEKSHSLVSRSNKSRLLKQKVN